MYYSTTGSTSGKVLAIANELDQRKAQLKHYKDILLTTKSLKTKNKANDKKKY